MDDAFKLLDPPNARAYLKSFANLARRDGEALFTGGHVKDLVPVNAGKVYSAQVEDGETCEVKVQYDPFEGWRGHCSCAQGNHCQHVFATMRALLVENIAATVRSLSAGLMPGPIQAELAASKGLSGRTSELGAKLIAAIGRPLNPEESKFVRTVQAAYERCEATGQITYWEFGQMGIPIGGFGWSPIRIWPSFPTSVHEFWLYVAKAAQEHGAKIPRFMQPITDFSVLEERLSRWKRMREIERWRQAIGNLQVGLTASEETRRGETDLRVVVDVKGIRMQSLRPGGEAFADLGYMQSRRLAEDYRNGTVLFTPEAELLWQFFTSRVQYGLALEMNYSEPGTAAVLSRMLKIQLLENRLVSSEGKPLERRTERLRWDLTPASGEEDDYKLRLVMPDGKPTKAIFCVLPGKPSLYLTADGVFEGPDPMQNLLDITRENLIPAPALERAPGVTMLQSLGLELPARVRERVRTLSYQIIVRCELRPASMRTKGEECVVRMVAEAADGRQQTWTSYSWTDSMPDEERNRQRDEEIIRMYDTAALSRGARLLESLPLRSSFPDGALAMKVTKRFPEVFSSWLKTVPPEIEVQLAGDLASFRTSDVAGTVKLEVSEVEIDWFDLRVALNVSDTTLTQEEIKLLLKAKGNYVRLEGKGWHRLQFDLSEEENERLARLGISARELSDEPQRLHALQLADEAARKFLPEEQVEQIQRRVSEIKARVAPNLPAGVHAELRPYQLEGFHFLAYLATNRFGGILADDMGLGKTLQALAWVLWLRESAGGTETASAGGTDTGGTTATTGQPQSPPSLVVCPKSVTDNWHAEAARFTPGLRVRVWAAGGLGELTQELGSADLHVINYAQLRLMGESLVPVRWLAVILDEGQYIKNPSSQTAQIARALKAEHRLVLSGTPIENRLLDLWSLMAFAMPGVLGSRAQFGRLYDAKGDPFARRRLSSRVRPFLLRRTKAQVAKDLPDRIEEDLFCEIEGEQKTLYRAELKRAQQLLLGIQTQKEVAKFQFHFLTSLLRLRQICCDPRLVNPGSKAVSAKGEALLEQLEPLIEEGNKVLVFSQFVELLDLLKPVVEGRNWPVFYLAGETENRGELVQRFQSTEGPAVFLISLKAGGFGLNLTAASYVVLFDPWWNPAVENQAIDRTHRIGQVNKVIAYRLLIKDSIEEKIRALQKTKKALAEDVLGEERFAQSLTLEDLHFLFAD